MSIKEKYMDKENRITEEARKLKILLLEPLCPVKAAWGSVKSLQGHLPPVGVISVYSWLKHRGYNVDFLDTQFGDFTPETLRARMREGRYNVVGMSVYTPTADYAFNTAKLVKEALPSCKVVMGNIHVTVLPELSMRQCPEIDFIVRGEGEYVMDRLLSELASGRGDWSKIEGLVYRDADRVVVNPPAQFIGELDELPLGFYGDLDLKRYVPHMTQYVVLPNYSVMTQRGCSFSCTYCGAAKILGKRTRYYSPKRIVEELKILKTEKNARGVYFQDSTFTANRKFTVELMNLMIEADLGLLWSCNTRADCVDPELLRIMYRAGGRQIAVGVESGNQESLDMVKKNTTLAKQEQGVKWIRQAGFRCNNSFIICLPNETEAMVRNTINFAKRLKAPIAVFWFPVPYPGTELYKACEADGGLRRMQGWNDYLSLNFDDPIYVNPILGVDKMKYLHKRANFEYYLSPAIWWENVRIIRTPNDLRRLAQGGMVLLDMVANIFMNGLSRLKGMFSKDVDGNEARSKR